MGVPDWWYNYMIDTHHTPHYAAGYMFDQVQPRIAMITHMEYEQDIVNEVTAGVREHYDGLFAFGAPDVQVVNVTKEAIWVREAALPEMAGSPRPNPLDMFPGGPGHDARFDHAAASHDPARGSAGPVPPRDRDRSPRVLPR